VIEELGASRATIKHDLDYMRDFMNAPIVYARDANGYRYDPDAPAFELPGLLSPYIGPLRGRIRRLLEQSGTSAEQDRPTPARGGGTLPTANGRPLTHSLSHRLGNNAAHAPHRELRHAQPPPLHLLPRQARHARGPRRSP